MNESDAKDRLFLANSDDDDVLIFGAGLDAAAAAAKRLERTAAGRAALKALGDASTAAADLEIASVTKAKDALLLAERVRVTKAAAARLTSSLSLHPSRVDV